jgi:hypothetical protein
VESAGTFHPALVVGDDGDGEVVDCVGDVWGLLGGGERVIGGTHDPRFLSRRKVGISSYRTS